MKTQFKALALFVLLGTLILSACGGAAAPAATEAAAATEAPMFAMDMEIAEAAKQEPGQSAEIASAPVYDANALP